MNAWYAVHTQSNAEQKAAAHLRNQGYEIYLPYYHKTRRHARRVEQIRAPLFPGYLFVRLDVSHTRWRSINGTFGVRYILCNGEHPISLPRDFIDDIRSREDATGGVLLNKILPVRPGDRIRFIAGPMIDQTGIFECERDEDRVIVLLNLVGRSTRVLARTDTILGCA